MKTFLKKLLKKEKIKNITPFGGSRGIFKNFYYESKWELAFIKFCLKNDIGLERNKKGFVYWFEDKKHKYYPDFYLPEVDQYVEIKNDYLLKQKKEQVKINQFSYKLDIYDNERMRPILKEIKYET